MGPADQDELRAWLVSLSGPMKRDLSLLFSRAGVGTIARNTLEALGDMPLEQSIGNCINGLTEMGRRLIEEPGNTFRVLKLQGAV